MTWLSLGSLALPYQLQNQGVALRSDMARLSAELSSGTVSDPVRHLRGDIGPLAAITAQTARNAAWDQNTRTRMITTDAVQRALGRLDSLRSDTASRMMAAAGANQAGANLAATGAAATAAFGDAVSALSLQVAGAAPLSGAASDRVPLVTAQTMLGTLRTLIGGLDSAQAISDTIRSAFVDPGGAFDTSFYTGGAAQSGPVVGPDGQTPPLPTAADPAIRETLAGLATAALVADPALGMPDDQRIALARQSSEHLFGAAGPMAALQATVGDAQSSLETRMTRLKSEKDGLEIARQSMIGIDPFETATKLQSAQTQLETLYTITARTSRLSLTGYL